jgi:serine/threonine protein kinase
MHRDVKESNIYFNYAMEPRLSDFGSSQFARNSTDEDMLHHSPGYAPAEFSDSENTKSDVL